MKHTDFGEWRVTHDNFRIHHALQPVTLDPADYSDPEKLVDTVATIAAKDWISSRTMDDLLQALEFVVEEQAKAQKAKDARSAIDVESIKQALKAR